MAPRSSWKGYIRLSLVSVPVKAFTATSSTGEIRLNQLHAECNNRIKYQKTCPVHGEVPASEIVSGYEYAKGQYVVIDTEEVRKLRPQGDQSVHVKGFVPSDSIDTMYHAGRTYWLLPDGPVGQKPYQLLREGMVREDVHALAEVVMSGREQLVLLRPHDNLIAMSMLMHEAKVKGPEGFKDEIEDESVGEEELSLTRTLIGASRIDPATFGRFEDSYVTKLTEVIRAKVDGEEIVQVADPEEPQIINLMEALKASVERARAGGDEQPAPAGEGKTEKKTRRTARKMSPSTDAAARKKKAGGGTTRRKSG
jgi:DNA end-binding protein Ku